MIPFYDLKKINKKYKKSFSKSFNKIIDSGYYMIGEETNLFEKKFAKFCNTKYCIGVGNGLDALIITLKSYIELGHISKGDEVIVPANTYIATILSISFNELKPILVEPDPDTYNIDVSKIEKSISSKTKAIIAVHLYGQPANMKEIMRLANKYKLKVIEDAAQAHGALYYKKPTGSLGHVGCFSFFPGKNLGALGDAGAITTNNLKLNKIMRSLRNYGESNYSNISRRTYSNPFKGFNSRMDEIQASFLTIKLKNLKIDNLKRKKIASYYISKIKNPKLKLPIVPTNIDPVWHLFVITTKYRDKLISFLKRNGVKTLVHYRIPPHKQKAYKEWNNYNLPITEKIHREIVSIPLSITLSNQNQKKIVTLLNSF